MKKVIEAEMTIKNNNIKKAINKFFTKYDELEYWRELFEYMAENGSDFESDQILNDGTYNNNFRWALHLDINEDSIYMAVIERA